MKYLDKTVFLKIIKKTPTYLCLGRKRESLRAQEEQTKKNPYANEQTNKQELSLNSRWQSAGTRRN